MFSNFFRILYCLWDSVEKCGRLRLKCDGTCAETRFRVSAKRTSPFKSAGASVQSTTGSRGVRISGSNAGYTMFRGSVKSTGYPLHLSVSHSLPPPPCVTVCHHISIGIYSRTGHTRQYNRAHALWMLDNKGYLTHTQNMYYCAFPRQRKLHERAYVTLYVHCPSCWHGYV
jgi:hypothetical protein